MNTTMIELSVVLPCLNEAETLATCITKARASMEALGVDGEVVVADNGSTDGSQAIAESLGARVVPVPERGYGAALRTGIAAAEGRFVIMADADDSYALDDLGPFVDALRGGADLVMGNRFAGGIEPGAMPALHRYLGNPVLSWVGRLFFRVPINDFHCGMRGFRRNRVLELGLTTVGMEFASEMVVRSAINGLHITEVPTTLKPDGRSRAPTCARGATAGGTCASSWRSAPAGCSSTRRCSWWSPERPSSPGWPSGRSPSARSPSTSRR